MNIDYSDIEKRILALVELDLTTVDLHTVRASEIFSVPQEKVTPWMRRYAKHQNYMDAYGVVREVNTPARS